MTSKNNNLNNIRQSNGSNFDTIDFTNRYSYQFTSTQNHPTYSNGTNTHHIQQRELSPLNPFRDNMLNVSSEINRETPLSPVNLKTYSRYSVEVQPEQSKQTNIHKIAVKKGSAELNK